MAFSMRVAVSSGLITHVNKPAEGQHAMLARLHTFRFDWKLTLLTALLLPLLLSLGFWQLGREQEKLDLQTLWDARQREAPVQLAALDPADDLQYRLVDMSGTVDNAHVFLLDNRVHQGQPGYDVVVPVTTADAQLVFVNRGWIAQGPSRAQLPPIDAIEGQVMLRGSVYVPMGEPFTLGGDAVTETWPRVVQTLDPAAMARHAGLDEAALFPYIVRLADGAPGVYVRDWPVISATPEKHRGYAVQWFAMATMLLGLYLYYSSRADAASAT
jgi:cytochrome oxidase assembly protein ShyY1